MLFRSTRAEATATKAEVNAQRVARPKVNAKNRAQINAHQGHRVANALNALAKNRVPTMHRWLPTPPRPTAPTKPRARRVNGATDAVAVAEEVIATQPPRPKPTTRSPTRLRGLCRQTVRPTTPFLAKHGTRVQPRDRQPWTAARCTVPPARAKPHRVNDATAIGPDANAMHAKTPSPRKRAAPIRLPNGAPRSRRVDPPLVRRPLPPPCPA